MSVDPSIVYRDGGKLVRATGESPQQFKGVLFVTLEGDTPNTVGEHLRTLDQLRGLQIVDEPLTVEWVKALGLPEVEPIPNRQDTPQSRKAVYPSDSVTPEDLRREAKTKAKHIIETKYVHVNPNLGWMYLNYFLGLGLLITMLIGFNGPWLFLIVFLSLIAVGYATSANYLAGKELNKNNKTTRYI